MTVEEIILILKIERRKADIDFYPDRRIALDAAIDAMYKQREGGDTDVHRRE